MSLSSRRNASVLRVFVAVDAMRVTFFSDQLFHEEPAS
jgi:hypothetical protein